jgi:protein-tyrosine phosphatase
VSSHRQVSRWKATAASAGLSILFLAVYSSCNWIAAHRAHVGSIYFEWERHIPFVSWMILPYMSLDLFFIGAPFLCRTNNELRVFSRRIVAAILVAGIFFLIFPLRFAFPRPDANGWLGVLFNWFRGMDAPYNLLPSLHAALLLLVADVYARHLRGSARIAAISWFVLIGFSPIFTYQHHVIDIASGFVLAAYCFYFLPDRRFVLPVTKNGRIGAYYGTGAAMLFGLAPLFWPWGAGLVWPAIALAIVAGSYFGAGPGIFRKTHGRLPWSTRFALAPCLAGQYLSLLYYKEQCRPWDAVTPQVWIGRRLSRRETKRALRSGVTAVLDLSAELSESEPFRNSDYHNILVLDLTAPTQSQLFDIGRFIANRAWNGVVYVHCKIGYSRSAAAVAAYLIMSGRANTATEAFDIIRRARPGIVIRPEVIAALSEFQSRHQRTPANSQPFVLASDHPVLA